MKWLFYLNDMKQFFLIIFLSFFLYSCKNREEKNAGATNPVIYTPIVSKGMMDQINHADSAVVIYYNAPANPRFYKVFKTSDLQLLQSIISDVNSVLIQQKNDCPSLGKLYFYGKGDIVDVVYFSNADSCKSLSFIKNGEKYSTRMGEQSQRLIDSIGRYAK